MPCSLVEMYRHFRGMVLVSQEAKNLCVVLLFFMVDVQDLRNTGLPTKGMATLRVCGCMG
jgi:hypothetical protein